MPASNSSASLVQPVTAAQDMARSNPPVAWATLAFAIIAALFLSQPALAQGTFGSVPDPISSRDLATYAARLNLSAQQIQAFDSLHTQYLDSFNALREGEIQRYLDSLSSGRGPMGMLSDPREAERALRGMNDIMIRIRTVDHSLFDQIQALLTSEQADLFPRIRQLRDRQRYESGVMRLGRNINAAARLDLSEMVADEELPQDARAAIDPTLAQYESALTNLTRAMYDNMNDAAIKSIRSISTSTTGQDGRQMRESFGAIFAQVGAVAAKDAMQISTLNRRSLANIAALLEPENARSLRSRYFRRAYPEASRDRLDAARQISAALVLTSLTDEQRNQVQSLATEYFTAIESLTERMADIIDQQRSTLSQNMFGFGTGGGRGGRGGGGGGGGQANSDNAAREAGEQQLRDLRNRRQDKDTATVAALAAILTEDQLAATQRRQAGSESAQGLGSGSDPSRLTVAAGAAERFGPRASPTSDQPNDSDGDDFLPGPITRRDIQYYARTLKLTSDQRPVLDMLYEDYLSEFRALRETGAIADADNAARDLWRRGEDARRPEPPTDQQIERVFSLRQGALDMISQLDTAFFDNVEIALGADAPTHAAERIRLSRQRSVYARGGFNAFGGRGGPGGGGPGAPGGRGGQGGFGGGRDASQELRIDLGRLIDDLSESLLTGGGSLDPQVAQSLLQHEQNVTSLIRQAYDASVRFRRETTLLGARAARDGGNQGAGPGRFFQPGSDDPTRVPREAALRAQRQVIDANRAALQQLAQQLTPEAAQALRNAYNRQAFPAAYRDGRAVDLALSRALELDDLESRQQSGIQTLIAEYRGSYESLCEQLVELYSGQSDAAAALGGGGQTADWEAFRRRQQAIEQIEFQRNELNDKTRNKLRALLTEQQLERIAPAIEQPDRSTESGRGTFFRSN